MPSHREAVLPKLHLDEDYPCSLVGNWNTWYGEQDQAGELPTSSVPLLPSPVAALPSICTVVPREVFINAALIGSLPAQMLGLPPLPLGWPVRLLSPSLSGC